MDSNNGDETTTGAAVAVGLEVEIEKAERLVVLMTNGKTRNDACSSKSTGEAQPSLCLVVNVISTVTAPVMSRGGRSIGMWMQQKLWFVFFLQLMLLGTTTTTATARATGHILSVDEPFLDLSPCGICNYGEFLIEPDTIIPVGTISFINENVTCIQLEQMTQDAAAAFSTTQCKEIHQYKFLSENCRCHHITINHSQKQTQSSSPLASSLTVATTTTFEEEHTLSLGVWNSTTSAVSTSLELSQRSLSNITFDSTTSSQNGHDEQQKRMQFNHSETHIDETQRRRRRRAATKKQRPRLPQRCPNSNDIQSPYIKNNFSNTDLNGVWYELAMIDIAQPRYCSCQTSIKRVDTSKQTIYDLWRLQCYGAVYDSNLTFAIDDTDPGKMNGTWNLPLINKIIFPNTVVDVGINKQTKAIDWEIEFQCIDTASSTKFKFLQRKNKSSISYYAFNFYSKTYNYNSPALIQQMTQAVRDRGLGVFLDASIRGLHIVDHTDCLEDH